MPGRCGALVPTHNSHYEKVSQKFRGYVVLYDTACVEIPFEMRAKRKKSYFCVRNPRIDALEFVQCVRHNRGGMPKARAVLSCQYDSGTEHFRLMISTRKRVLYDSMTNHGNW